MESGKGEHDVEMGEVIGVSTTFESTEKVHDRVEAECTVIHNCQTNALVSLQATDEDTGGTTAPKEDEEDTDAKDKELLDRLALLQEMDESLQDGLPSSPKAGRSSRSGQSQLQYAQRLQAWRGNRRRTVRQSSDSSDDGTLMMIAKKRATMGGGAETLDPTAKTNHCECETNLAVNGRGTANGAREVLRPGAYAAIPGDGFKRCRTFAKECLAHPGKTPPAAAVPDFAARSPQSPKRGRRRVPRVARSPKRQSAPSAGSQEEDSDPNWDRKPAAKPPTLAKRHTTLLCASDEATDANGADRVAQDDHHGRKGRATSMTGLDRIGSRADADARSRWKQRASCSKNMSMRLSMLARSIDQDSCDSSGSMSSQKLITELAEQSVSNFVRSFQRTNTLESLPIAATVVPSEEDLEYLIRSRLEAELQSHLTQELATFRQNLLYEIMRRQVVQVADPVSDDEDPETGGFHTDGHQKLPPLRTLMEQFCQEDHDDPDLDETDTDPDGIAELDSAVPVTRPGFCRRTYFRDSIRQSIRVQLSSLEDELDVEQAQVIPNSRGSNDGNMETTMSTLPDDLSVAQKVSLGEEQKIQRIKLKVKLHAFTSRGLFGIVLLVFLIGAFVGAGTSILTMQSIRKD